MHADGALYLQCIIFVQAKRMAIQFASGTVGLGGPLAGRVGDGSTRVTLGAQQINPRIWRSCVSQSEGELPQHKPRNEV